jgi:hypothetical protein
MDFERERIDILIQAALSRRARHAPHVLQRSQSGFPQGVSGR